MPTKSQYTFFLFIIFVSTLMVGCYSGVEEAPVDRVDPLIGTGTATTPSAQKHSEADNEPRGQTMPAVGVPFGMTQWTPQTRDTEEKCISPYYHADSLITGFRGSHWMTGSCTQDYGSFTIMPLADQLRILPEDRALPFSHDAEESAPHYYKVHLDGDEIDVEMTASNRTGFLRFIFREAQTAYITLQPNSDEGEGSIVILPDQNEVLGENPAHRIYQGWGQSAGFSGHFSVTFSRPFDLYGIWQDSTVYSDETISHKRDSSHVMAYVGFDISPGDTIDVRIGTSFTSLAGARSNQLTEMPAWEFDYAKDAAYEAWDNMLGRIQVSGGTNEQRTTFYTALYHSLILPRVFSDTDGSYVGFAENNAINQTNGFDYYVDFSVWDTYRAVHPLLTIIAPERAGDMVRSLVIKADQGDWLPIFPSWNSYTSAMIGDHVTAIITDAYLKGIQSFDAELAYAKMRKNAMKTPDYDIYLDGKGRRALPSYLRYGYIPLEDSVKEAFHQQEQVSRTLEYAYNDFNVAQMAKALGHSEDATHFFQRALNYRNVLDPETGFARGRYADGTWYTPFDPAERTYEFITEGSPWHYTWYVPHDVEGLIQHIGGREPFIARLDTLFESGEYWHGNEPSHQIAYMYAYAGAPWKTQQRIRDIMHEEYSTGPGGLSGNDDAGQMSAWYVFSAIGMYPVSPGFPYYVLGSPLFKSVVINLPEDKTFVIEAPKASNRNKYIQSAVLNGEPLERAWIWHEEIADGGILELTMGPSPNPDWASEAEQAPPSLSTIRLDP